MPAISRARAIRVFGRNDFGDQSETQRFGSIDNAAAQEQVARLLSPIWRRRKTETIAGMKPIFTSV